MILKASEENFVENKLGAEVVSSSSDDLTHDKVVVLSPEIKMGYVKPVS